ncbi:hypothetical protein PHJA_001089500 [Phtheirospermum japonicum]|uniref:Uncharacterized protein n=1 Tax=Phtheirospermum japonicum TaxID=374723 RepID=A0A830BTQ4_9LAMI|nr:hypothetical protein PHJA_001089500 [Phtheirospermum japonicum]
MKQHEKGSGNGNTLNPTKASTPEKPPQPGKLVCSSQYSVLVPHGYMKLFQMASCFDEFSSVAEIS